MSKQDDFYAGLQDSLRRIITENSLEGEEVVVHGRVLTPEEAIGRPEKQDYPLFVGKESLMEADFRGSKGQAFTDMPGTWSGTLNSIVSSMPVSNFDKALLVSVLNAVCRNLGISTGTVHCRNEEPETCATQLLNMLLQRHKGKKIGIVGYQPSLIQKVASEFSLRVIDLNPDNIGTNRYGVLIENGMNNKDEHLEWADVLLVTGSTCCNGTVTDFTETGKPVYFYGTTVSACAALMDLDRFCPCSH